MMLFNYAQSSNTNVNESLIHPNIDEMLLYDDELEVAIEATTKSAEYTKHFSLRDKYYPRIAHLLPKTEHLLLKHIVSYRDKYNDILSSPYPITYPKFGIEDREILFKVTQIDEKEMLKDIYDTILPYNPAELKNFKPITVVLYLIMRYYLVTEQQDKLALVQRYYAYSIYWSVYSIFFGKFPPNKETIIYSVNDLTKKSKLKAFGSVDDWIHYQISNTIISYSNDREVNFVRSSDYDMFYIIGQFKGRLKNQTYHFSKEFKANRELNNVTFTSTTMLDNIGTQRNLGSVSSEIESQAQALTTNFMSTSAQKKYASLCGKLEGVSANELILTIEALQREVNSDDIKKYYAALLYLYLNSDIPGASSDNIKSPKFMGVMSEMYKKGNTNNENIIYIKDKLNEWLTIGSKTYRNSNRAITLNSLKKAMFTYFLMTITM